MQDQIISFKTAILAKEKGFNYLTSNNLYYNSNGQLNTILFSEEDIPAPTQSLLQKWLRDKHNIIITVDICNGEKNEKIFFSKIYVVGLNPKYKNEFSLLWTSDFFTIYEEAFEEGLTHALNLIK